MNMVSCERPEQVFLASGGEGSPLSESEAFVYPFRSDLASCRASDIGGALSGAPDGSCTLARFKSRPLLSGGSVGFSAHLCERDHAFKDAWRIYMEAFSDLERRTEPEHNRVMAHPRYRFSAIIQNSATVGVLACWLFPEFCFVEHLAIDPERRSSGLGRQSLDLLKAVVQRPIVLDVEPFGSDYAAARRIAFYTRQGFSYCGEPVTLPPYEGKQTAPSHFMTWPMELHREARISVLRTIEREIYGISSAGSFARSLPGQVLKPSKV